MKIWQQFKNTYESHVLIKWVVFTELFYLLFILLFVIATEFEGNGFTRYVGLKSEGVQTIKVLRYSESEVTLGSIGRFHSAKRITGITYRLECSTILNGEKVLFTTDAVDVTGENSLKTAREYALDNKEVKGYLFSSSNRENIAFSVRFDDGNRFLAEKIKARIQLFYQGNYIYKIILYIIIGIFRLGTDKIKENKSFFDIAGEVYLENRRNARRGSGHQKHLTGDALKADQDGKTFVSPQRQVILFLGALIILAMFWMICREWLFFPKIAIYLEPMVLFRRFVGLSGKEYKDKYGTETYEKMLSKICKVPCSILIVISAVLIWIK